MRAERRNVHVIAHVFKVYAGHADFLSLIHKRRARQEEIRVCKHFRRQVVISLFVAETGNRTGLVVVFHIVCVPRDAVHFVLPRRHDFFKFFEFESRVHAGVADAVRFHMLEMEHHIKVLFVAFFYEFEGDIGRHSGRFADGHAVVFAPAFVFELLKIFVKVRSPVIVRNAAHDG